MRQRIYDILKGKVLLEEGAEKNWVMLLFLSFLALVMIATSHSAERKVYELASKKQQLKKYRSEFAMGTFTSYEIKNGVVCEITG